MQKFFFLSSHFHHFQIFAFSGKPTGPPSKKLVGRPPKPLSNEQINRMLEQNHDFEELKQWCKISNMKIANFYLHGEKINIDGNIHKTRKRYTKKTKLKIREHYLLMQNYATTAKEFGVNESTVRTIVKTPTRNCKLNDKGHHSGAGRPLTYPLEVEKDILSWLLELRDLHVPVSILTLQEKTKRVVHPCNPTFNASCGWVERFFARHTQPNFSKSKTTETVGTVDSKALRRCRTLHADREIPSFTCYKYGLNTCSFRHDTRKEYLQNWLKGMYCTDIWERKKHVTVVLSATANETMLPPMLIFKGKMDKTIKLLCIPKNLLSKRKRSRGWMKD